MKATFLSILCLCLLLTVWGCDSSDPTESSTPTAVETAELFAQEQFSQRDRDSSTEDSIPVHLTAQGPVCEDRGISVGKDSITVRSPGKYRFFGEYHGSIVVDVDKNDHVHLILDNAVITAEQTAALYVKQAEKVVVTLKGTNRLLTEEPFSTEGGNKIDAVIFAKDDLSFNGEGALFLQSPDHGIVCKDDLVFLGGSYDIKAQRHGISTEGSIRVGDGTFTLETQKDGMNTDNSVDPLSAYIYIAKGSFTLQAGGDGISTDSALRIDDGSFILTTGGGSSKGKTHYEEAPGFRPTRTAVTEDSSTGTKGMARRCGVIDSGYRSEWFVCMTNTTEKGLVISKFDKMQTAMLMCENSDGPFILSEDDVDECLTVYPYTKAIAQALVIPVPEVEVETMSYEDLKAIPSERGLGALGSSGK
jgi:dUTPase